MIQPASHRPVHFYFICNQADNDVIGSYAGNVINAVHKFVEEHCNCRTTTVTARYRYYNTSIASRFIRYFTNIWGLEGALLYIHIARDTGDTAGHT
jgi:hypothetical protein